MERVLRIRPLIDDVVRVILVSIRGGRYHVESESTEWWECIGGPAVQRDLR
jgi:hypothetical protein